MDQLPPLGTAIGQIVMPTFKIYTPLLIKQAQKIRSTRRETFTYGAHSRQSLDVYYPTPQRDSKTERAKVLVFLYGGGLVNGAKSIPTYADGLVHANIGHFFSENYGYTVVVPDYRLLQHGARFPSGGEDLSLVVEWIRTTLSQTPGYSSIDLSIMGNSAGGIHLSTYLFHQEFSQSRQSVSEVDGKSAVILRSVVLLSVPFYFKNADASRGDTLRTYFGDDLLVNSPLGLLQAAAKRQPEGPLPGIAVLVLNGTLDPEDEIMDPRDAFLQAWKEGDGAGYSAVKVEMMEGHNHISPPQSLGTGIEKEEAWGHQVAQFLATTNS